MKRHRTPRVGSEGARWTRTAVRLRLIRLTTIGIPAKSAYSNSTRITALVMEILTLPGGAFTRGKEELRYARILAAIETVALVKSRLETSIVLVKFGDWKLNAIGEPSAESVADPSALK